MPRGPIDWLITDTHWYHDQIVTNCGRPADHMEIAVKWLRYYVMPQDRLFHLGDVIFYRYPVLKNILGAFPGKKILLMGNHDHQSRGWYERNGFDFVADMIVIGDILLSHHPQPVLPVGVRINIHGHWHNYSWVDNKPAFWSATTHRLLSLESEKYKPVKLMEFAK